MAGKVQPFDRVQCIESLAIPHDGVDKPDQTMFSYEALSVEADWSDEDLQSLRTSTKHKRKPKSTTGDGTRATFGKTGRFVVPLPFVIDDDQRKAFAAVGCKTAAQVGAYVLDYISSTKDEGSGRLFYTPKEERPDGVVLVNATKAVDTAIDSIQDVALQRKRNLKMAGAYDVLVAAQDMMAGSSKQMSDDDIENMLRDAARDLEYSQIQTDACIAHVYKT